MYKSSDERMCLVDDSSGVCMDEEYGCGCVCGWVLGRWARGTCFLL